MYEWIVELDVGLQQSQSALLMVTAPTVCSEKRRGRTLADFRYFVIGNKCRINLFISFYI